MVSRKQLVGRFSWIVERGPKPSRRLRQSDMAGFLDQDAVDNERLAGGKGAIALRKWERSRKRMSSERFMGTVRKVLVRGFGMRTKMGGAGEGYSLVSGK